MGFCFSKGNIITEGSVPPGPPQRPEMRVAVGWVSTMFLIWEYFPKSRGNGQWEEGGVVTTESGQEQG